MRSVRSNIIHYFQLVVSSFNNAQFHKILNKHNVHLKLCSSEHKECVQNLSWDVWSLLASQTQRLNKRKVSKPDCYSCSTHIVHCKNYYLRWEKNAYMQILTGEISSSKLQKTWKIRFPYVEVPTCLQIVDASLTSEFVSEKRNLTVQKQAMLYR